MLLNKLSMPIKLDHFNVGDIITLKTHPMFKSCRIKGDSKQVPPLMLIIGVFDIKKGDIDRVKYDCIYFNDDKNEFVTITLYHFAIKSFESLLYERVNLDGTSVFDYKALIDEVKKYKKVKFKQGKIISFKTKKLEIYKKRTSKKIIVDPKTSLIEKIDETLTYVVSFATPDFIICEEGGTYPKGLLNNKILADSIVSESLLMVLWYNPIKQKYSQQFIPKECFAKRIKIKSDKKKKLKS